MSFQWQFVAAILYAEIAVSLLLCLPVSYFDVLSFISKLRQVHLVKMVERFLQVNTGAENGPAWHDDFLHTRHNPRTSLFRRLQGRVQVQQG